MTDETLSLAGDFAPADARAWRELVDKALKGAPFDKKLVTRSEDGFDIAPLYTADTTPESAANAGGLPGAAPFLRGRRAAGNTAGGWDIRQLYAHPDPSVANGALLDDLERGVTSLKIRLDAAGRAGEDADQSPAAGQDGVMIYDRADLDRLLADVRLDLVPIAFEAGAQAIPTAALYLSLIRARGLEPGGIEAAFNADPLGTLAAGGTLPKTLPDAIAETARFARKIDRLMPTATALAVDTGPYYEAGCTESQDLAYALATGVAYLRALSDAGLGLERACGQIAFSVALGTDFFAGIAKLRALRMLWYQVCAASGVADAARLSPLDVTSARRIMSRVDPWVNMLRTTLTSFAGGLGGADSVLCRPFDDAIGLPDDFARRIARNTQIILQEESQIHRVIDPAGGAWYIETLTRKLAERAWARFQDIEAAGGMAAQLQSGAIHADIATARQARDRRLATRRDPLTGVSEFPHLHEEPVRRDPPDRDALRRAAGAALAARRPADPPTGHEWEALCAAADAGASLGQLAAAGRGAGITQEPLRPHRYAEQFEALRQRAEARRADTGQLPAIFLAALGPVARHTARATFARNFFQAGGIDALGSGGHDSPEALAAAFADAPTTAAVLCGDDEQYEHVAAYARALKAAGATRIYLAGRPGAREAEWRAAGIDDFVGLGTDLPAVCGALQDHLEGA